MIYYLSKNYKDITSAGNKAKTDIEAIMADMGFGNAGLSQTVSHQMLYGYLRTLLGVIVAVFRIHKGDKLILQYPLKKYFTFVCVMAHLKGVKVVALIHDLGSFRRKALTIKQEINRLNHADVIIAHNERMKQWLEEQGCKAQLTTLGIFDYLSTSAPQAPSSIAKPYRVIYAGALNIRKNAFLYTFAKTARHYTVHLYGKGFDINQAEGKEQIHCMGFMPSDELIAHASGHFGLVWDGTSDQTCAGNFGEYLRYNNPHKTSLYLRCGMPVIIWDKAALAPFIRQHGVGVCIDSLENLDQVLEGIDETSYRTMRDKAYQMSQALNSGHFAREALRDAISRI